MHGAERVDSEGGVVPGPDVSLGEILDQHAELRDLVAEIRTTSDPHVLVGLLDRLRSRLEAHFALEESGERLSAARREGEDGEQVSRILAEHREILAALRALVRSLREDEAGAPSPTSARAEAILTRLQEHDAHESSLFARSAAVDPAAPSPDTGARSTALEVNLRRTAVDVVIPAEQEVLLEITADRYGVHQRTRAMLRELNHPYVGWAHALEELHRCAMGDFLHFVTHERAPEAVAVFCALYARVARRASPPALRGDAVRKLLRYLENAARESGRHLARILPALAKGLESLDEILGRDASLARSTSPGQKVLVAALGAHAEEAGAVLGQALDLLTRSLESLYTQWLEREDPARWWDARAKAFPGVDRPAEISAISHARLAAELEKLRRILERKGSPAGALRAVLELPDAGAIERAHLEAAAGFGAGSDDTGRWDALRLRWLIHALSQPDLSGIHERVLGEIAHTFAAVLRGTELDPFASIVHDVFAALRGSGLSTSETAQSLIARIGSEALASGSPERAEVVIDEILAWEFPRPDFGGFTDEWRVRVDRRHVQALRAHLAAVEANPELARPLLAALVVNLELGGVFLSDTDLFQRDVSRLLNAGIEPVYHQVRHLLRCLPVYFSEIGAEGALRETSSAIDEIAGRRDPLCHFLRKQCHVESNPRLVDFVEAVGRFFATGEAAPLRAFVPAELHERLDVPGDAYRGLHAVFSELCAGSDVSALFPLDPPALERRLASVRAGTAAEREKARLLFELRRQIRRKYALDHEDVLERLTAQGRAPAERVTALRDALGAGRHEAALELLLAVLEQQKEIVLDPRRTEGIEDIYRKRHIAAGIPSMYGRYREEKIEALGLSFRLESLASALFGRLFAERGFEYASRDTLRRVARWLRLLLRGLQVEGCKGRGPAAGISMLEQALASGDTSVEQYVNIFQFMSRSVENLIRIRFLDPYEWVLRRLLPGMLERGVVPLEPDADPEQAVLKVSETFLRDLIAESFVLSHLDGLLGTVLRTLEHARASLDPETLAVLMRYDASRSTVFLDEPESPLDGVMHLGNKGLQIRSMARDGLPVPPGFVLTTDVFRCRRAILRCPEVAREHEARLRQGVARLEERTGLRFADPERPLLFSVRSSGAISMPGMLDTFLNVGMSERVAEGFAAWSGSAWAAWDAYRRFLQLWGMAEGIDRTSFDRLIADAKRGLGVPKKALIPAREMRSVALRYRDLLAARGVAVPEDPFEQVLRCVDLAQRSWDAPKARTYRHACQISDDWGMAVIVQSMVYGNLSERSGTGAVFTCDPRTSSRDLRLSGDFVVQGQGDDVVAGLVETFPISEAQRLGQSARAAISLEKDFPETYRALEQHARTLVREQGMFHQEMEFTFESDDPCDLYILQTRDTVLSQVSDAPVFVPDESLESSRLARGIGAGGGALSGRVAHSAEDIALLRKRFGEDPIILLRPDTVPDDIPLILEVDGMVTSLGGATSHAAVAAQRLGRTCVVGCRQLRVDELRQRSLLGEEPIATGDLLSIDGRDGSIFRGIHRATTLGGSRPRRAAGEESHVG
jgi:pyruvate,orthophosphate dikinase